ncbi:MAG: adenylate/guanylate cyclase domain-containing protein [Candidatus Aegiribacteria sp.]
MRTLMLLVIATAVTLLLWSMSRLEFYGNLERSTLDLRFKLSPTVEQADSSVILVLLDGGSMDQLPWPVPRQLYADVLTLLQEWGAEVVAFDILFDMPSVYSVTEDSLFGEAAARGNTSFVIALLQRQGAEIPSNAVIPASIDGASLDSAWFCTPPNGMIAAGAEVLGSTSDRQDPDGVFRSVRLLTGTPLGPAPSLPLAIAWLAMGKPEVSCGPDKLDIGDVSLRTTGSCRLQLRFHGPAGTYRSFPLADLTASLNARAMGLPSPVDSTVFRGSVVLVGYAAPALYDLKPTPYSPQCPGVEVLATAVDNILNGNFLYTYPDWVSILSAITIAILTAVFLSSVDRIFLGTVLAVLPTALFLLASLLLFRSGYWLNTVWPASTGILTMLAGGIFLFSSETRRKQEIRSAFSQYLSPDVVAQVTENPEMLVLGGDRRRMTAFFSDIRGFTGISEKLSPEDLVSILNMYLTAMTDIILDTGGTVDKFEGDAIVAFWGAPIHMEDHAFKGCSAALRCQEAHTSMNDRLAREGYPELVTRIGLATGDMVVGNMGSSRRFDYTVMGSTVNLGARLEGVNKVYGTSIMVPFETRRDAGDAFVFRELDTVRVVGQQKPVTIFQLICRAGELSEDTGAAIRIYAEALELYRKGEFSGAAALFASASADDPPSGIMADRCRAMAEDPGDGAEVWTGVFNLTSK